MLRFLSLMVAPLLAQPLSAETLSEWRQKAAGIEVEVSGHIGSGLDIMDDEALSLRDEEGHVYSVVFDAGREVRKKLEGCKFAIFGGGSPCALRGKAEIELDGARLRLILFEVDEIDAPAPLK